MSRVVSGAATLLVVMLCLAGCSAPSEGAHGDTEAAAVAEEHGDSSTEAEGEHAEEPAESEHGEATEAEPSGDHGEEGPVELPVGFPSKDVPLVDHELLHVSNSGGIWGVWVASEDLAGDLAAATTLLLDAGFTQRASDPAYGEFGGEKFQLRVIASDSAKYGSSLNYIVMPVAP